MAKIQALSVTAPKGLDIFVWWSPHVQSFRVTIYAGGWTDEATHTSEVTVYLNWTNAEERLENALRMVTEAIEQHTK